LYPSKNIINLITEGGMKWAGHVACVGEMRNTCLYSRFRQCERRIVIEFITQHV